MDGPLVTIITAVRNGEKFIRDAVASIAAQSYSNIQHVIVDGKSTDNTVKIAKCFGRADVEILSEPDGGIADAWNKGLRLSKGEIIGFLNCDDYYGDNSVERAVIHFLKQNECVTYGDTVFVERENGRILGTSADSFDKEKLFLGFGFYHTTCFFSRCVLDKVGCFDKRYRIAIDTDWLFRCMQTGVKFEYIGNKTFMRTGGISFSLQERARFEYLRQLIKYGIFRKAAVREYVVRLLRNAVIVKLLLRWFRGVFCVDITNKATSSK